MPKCEYRYDRRQLGIYCAGSLAFVSLGFWLIWLAAPWRFGSWADAAESLLGLPVTVIGATSIVFFGMISIKTIGVLFDRSPVISIDDSSIRDRRWGGPVVPWLDIRSIEGVVIAEPDDPIVLGPRISLIVDDPSRYYRPTGPFARFTYGTMRNPLYFNMVALDGTDLELAKQLVVYAPDKFVRYEPSDED